MTLFNYVLDNDLVFGTAFAVTLGLITYGFTKSFINSFYVDKGIQTDSWEDYSDRPSQILSDNITSIDTVAPWLSPTESINQISVLGSTSEVGTQTITTVLPIPPMNIPMVPNVELITRVDQGVQTINNPMYGKDWNTIIEFINNKPSFFFDTPGCDTWIIPDPSVLSLISNSFFY